MQPQLSHAQLVRALGHDLAQQGFDADFIRDAQLIAIDRAMQLDDCISISQEAIDVTTRPSEDEQQRSPVDPQVA